MRRTPTYSFWKIWRDGEGRTWADPYYGIDVTAARRHHDEAKQFGWRVAGQSARMVSTLHGHDGTHSVMIADGAREEESERKPQTFHERLTD